MSHKPSQPAPGNDIGVRLQGVARALRRRRRLRLGIRAVWLALAIWCVYPLASILGWSIPSAPVLALALTVLIIGWLHAWLSQPSIAQLATGLDRYYALDEQLATALEVSRRAPATPIEERLLGETDGLIQRMRAYFTRQPLLPWREIETLAAVCLLFLGLSLASSASVPDAITPAAIPDLPPPEAPTEVARPEPTDQPVAEAPTPPPLSPAGQEAAAAIADALRDNGATRSAAEALDRGDTEGAARDLRELADQAEQLGDGARQDIARGLRDAAEQLRESQPELAERLEQQAAGLEQGGQPAADALEDLARAVEELRESQDQVADAGEQPAESPGAGAESGAGQPNQAQGAGQQPGGAGAGNQLGGEQRGAQPGVQPQGDTLPLPEPEATDGPTTPAVGPRGPQIELGAGGTGEAGATGSGGSDQPLTGEADPLAIPPEYRDVVEDYFSPQP